MLTQSGMTKKEYVAPKQILFCVHPQVAVSVKLKTTTDKLVKSGTPITGNLMDRSTAFTEATGSAVTGVTLHDVMCKAGQEMNSECLIFGFVDVDKVDADVKALYTDTVKTALNAKVTFLSGK